MSDICNIFENNEYIYFGGYISMKYLAILVLLGVGFVPFASAAQLESEILYGAERV